MPSPTGFNLLSSSSKSTAPQGHESRRSDSGNAADFQRAMERPADARPKPEVRGRPDSAPAQARESGPARANAERRSPIEASRTERRTDKLQAGEAKETGVEAQKLREDSESSSSAPSAEDWLSTIESPETLAKLDISEQSGSADTLSLDQLVEKLKQLLDQTEAAGSASTGELRSLLARLEEGVDSSAVTPEMLRQLESGLTAILADKELLQGLSRQIVSQLQALLNESRQVAGKLEPPSAISPEIGKALEGKAELKGNASAAELGVVNKDLLEPQPSSKIALTKLGLAALETREAGALEKGGSKASAMINQLSGAEVGNARTPQLQPTERSFLVQSDVRVPVGQPQWSQAVGERVLWMAAQNLTSAELRLDPPDLGPMQVRVSMNSDQVNISFSSQQVAVREALDQGAQRLREMFNEQGLKLGDVNVSDQSEGRQFSRDRDSEGQGRRGSGASEDDEIPLLQGQLVSMRLVDHYA